MVYDVSMISNGPVIISNSANKNANMIVYHDYFSMCRSDIRKKGFPFQRKNTLLQTAIIYNLYSSVLV